LTRRSRQSVSTWLRKGTRMHHPDIVVEPRSLVGRALLRFLPRIRGFAILGSTACRLIPGRHEAALHIADREITVDLKRRSQFAVAVLKPELTETRLLLNCLRAGDVFFDVGSNWGYYTLLAASVVGDRGLVVSIEADPGVVPQLLEAVNRSGVANVLVVNAAVTERAGLGASLRRPFYKADTAGFVDSFSSSRRGATVVTRTLDMVWRQVGCPGVRMMKIDIEGFEPLAIRGARELLTSGGCDFVQVEVSNWAHERCGAHHEQIYADLTQWGFHHAYMVARNGELRTVALDSGEPLPVGTDVIFSRRPMAGWE